VLLALTKPIMMSNIMRTTALGVVTAGAEMDAASAVEPMGEEALDS
jgi:hypothetical protein